MGGILFVAVFVFGLTRHLGNLMTSGREQQAHLQGPEIGRVVPPSVTTPQERDALVNLMDARQTDWTAVITVDDRCAGCDQLLGHIEEHGVPEGAPLLVLSRTTTDTYRERLGGIADLVITDEHRLDRAKLKATPFTMIVDRDFRLVQKAIGADLDLLLARWRTADAARQHVVALTSAKEGDAHVESLGQH